MTVPDVSDLAKSIKRALDKTTEAPSHVELLNILARSAGYRNFQHLKACNSAEQRLADPAPHLPEAPPPIDHKRIEIVLRCFDDQGVLMRWPSKTAQQKLALWWVWAAIPARRDLSEPEVNIILKRLNGFGDHVLIRRELIDWGMMSRSLDCRLYRRVEQMPPPEATVLIRHLQERIRRARPPGPFGRVRPVRPAVLPTSP
jgi:hypothetical protein